MAEFLEERIPVGVRYGATYGDKYAVDIVVTADGSEYRRLINPYPIRIFEIEYRLNYASVYGDLLNLYHRAYGKYAGFRAKCLDDYTTNGQITAPTATDQTLTQLTSTTYQLIKYYGTDKSAISVGYPYRNIYKPVSGTTKVAIGGVEQESGWSVSTTTGVVTFDSPPGDTVTGGCEFDIPVRFDSDLNILQNAPDIRDIGAITLIELLNP